MEVPFVIPHPSQLQSSLLNRCMLVTMATAELPRPSDPGEPTASHGFCLASRELDGETDNTGAMVGGKSEDPLSRAPPAVLLVLCLGGRGLDHQPYWMYICPENTRHTYHLPVHQKALLKGYTSSV